MEKIESREYAAKAIKEIKKLGSFEEFQLKNIELEIAIAHETGEIYQLRKASKHLKGQKSK